MSHIFTTYCNAISYFSLKLIECIIDLIAENAHNLRTQNNTLAHVSEHKSNILTLS